MSRQTDTSLHPDEASTSRANTTRRSIVNVNHRNQHSAAFLQATDQRLWRGRRSPQTISWLSTEKNKLNKNNLDNTRPKWCRLTQNTKIKKTKPLQKRTKTNLNLSKHKFKTCSYLCAYCCAQLSYTTQRAAVLIVFPPLPPDSHHSSDAVYRRRRRR